jgi:hypothetical protein
MRAVHACLASLALLGCSEPATHTGPPVVQVRLMLEPSAAKAVHLQVAGPGTNAFTSGGTSMLVESVLLSDRIAVAAFGDPLQGPVGILTGVAPVDAGTVQVLVLAAVDQNNKPLPSGSVVARVVVDTVR